MDINLECVKMLDLTFYYNTVLFPQILKIISTGKDMEKLGLSTLLVETGNDTATVENSMDMPQKIKNRTTR